MQVFILGPPRSGTTIVAQALNSHPSINIYDEVSLLDVLDYGPGVVGKGRDFLVERGLYDEFCLREEEEAECARALDKVLSAAIAPRTVWGEKNPMYVKRLDDLTEYFPEALLLFVLRDPRRVVNSYLKHRLSSFRSDIEFWITDTVSEAAALVEDCVQPVLQGSDRISVLRYESFVAEPATMLNAIFERYQLRFSEPAIRGFNWLPEGVGNQQFYRNGSPLPWKTGNLSPLRNQPPEQGRYEFADPAWSRVDALAGDLGYL